MSTRVYDTGNNDQLPPHALITPGEDSKPVCLLCNRFIPESGCTVRRSTSPGSFKLKTVVLQCGHDRPNDP
jgi:hypothetical protein